jgi:hypothetical protein
MSFNCALEGVIDGKNPAVHIFSRRTLIYSLVLRSNDLEAKPTFGIAGFSHRCHTQVNGLPV